jgi:fumarylacetoacetase
MIATPDATNDPSVRSFLAAANETDCAFPLQNLPFGVFRLGNEEFRGGVAIGDQILDLKKLSSSLSAEPVAAAALKAGAASSLNGLMQLGPKSWNALRKVLFEGLREGASQADIFRACLVPQREVNYALPAQIGDFTDFYTSIFHATAIGRLFRPDNPLLPNYKWVPIGYHGRSSSVGVSGQSFPRPQGQRLPPGESVPSVAPSKRLDYELEMGLFVGAGNTRGKAIPMKSAEDHIFGLCLLNDWSARDLQAWEYQPLGPFLAKNFATTVSPWVVTLQALAPFRTGFSRPQGDPEPLPYLASEELAGSGAIDIRLEAYIQSATMREAGVAAHRLSSTSFKHSYWTISQLIAHHTVNGCDLRAGDLLGTGTQSGPTPAEAGSLVELTVGGSKPIKIAEHETRTFLEDGDIVTFRAWCEKPGAVHIGFGDLQGHILPADTAGA